MSVICDYCGNPSSLVSGKEIYPHRQDLSSLQFWLCAPCKAWVGCHKRSKAVPLGRLANSQLRVAKSRAHAAFDPIWKSGKKSRRGAYEWLSKRLDIAFKDCHIGMFDIETCDRVFKVCVEFHNS